MQRSFGLLICYFAVAKAYKTPLYFNLNGSICDNKYRIYDDKDMYDVRWNGGSMNCSCKITFDPINREKQICVKAYSYYVNTCNMKLKYYGGLIATILKRTYSCYDSKPEEFCGETLKNVAVQLSSVSNSSSSSFALKIYRTTPVDLSVIIGCSVGGAYGTMIIVTVVVITCRRSGKRTGTVFRNTPGYPQSIVTSTNNTTNMTYGGNVNSYPLSPYPGTTNIGYNGTTVPVISQHTGYSGTPNTGTSTTSWIQ